MTNTLTHRIYIAHDFGPTYNRTLGLRGSSKVEEKNDVFNDSSIN